MRGEHGRVRRPAVALVAALADAQRVGDTPDNAGPALDEHRGRARFFIR